MATDTSGPAATAPPPAWQRALLRKDVLSGLLFMAIALLGLWLSRDYPIGTALRMSTGYVPRLLCWTLLALGAVILVIGLRTSDFLSVRAPGTRWTPFVLIPLALLAFGLTVERIGIVLAGALLIGIASLAGRHMRPLEVLLTGAFLVFVTWAIFVWGLALTIPVWPGD